MAVFQAFHSKGKRAPIITTGACPVTPEMRAPKAAIRHALFGLGRAFDLIVMPTEKFERGKHVIGAAAWPASQSGKVIYDAA
jgi:hypothetical protein